MSKKSLTLGNIKIENQIKIKAKIKIFRNKTPIF